MRASPGNVTRIGFAVGHSIFTPQDTEAFGPLPDQHPYAGWLYGDYSVLVERDGSVLDMLTVSAGVVGPAALGEEVQNNFHRLINGDRVNGWNNQLRNEPGLTLTYERRWRPFFRLSRPSAGQAGPDARRPVLMTALVASLGFIPMALNVGAGADVVCASGS